MAEQGAPEAGPAGGKPADGGPGDKPKAGEDAFGFLKWLIDLLRGEHPVVGYGVILALVVVFAALAARQTGIVADGLEDTAIFIGKFVGAGILVIAVSAFLKRFPFFGNLAFGLLFLFAVVYASCFFVQVITNNSFAAIPRAPCFYLLTAQGCPLSTDYTAVDVAAAPAETVEPVAPSGPVRTTHQGAVYVHFAGALDRAEVTKVTQELAGLGWRMQDGARGGDRIGTAAGLNEVRYFREADREAAEQLAATYSALATWTTGAPMKVRDLSKAGLRTAPGLLEIWTSRT